MGSTEGLVGVAERRSRQRLEREHRITDAARVIAEAEGWEAVTIRRLAEAIEYSQPVLYAHFSNRDAIVAAVALQGFQELAESLRHAAKGCKGERSAVSAVASAYLAFAVNQPALYQAMFTMPISLRFARPETPPELRDAFAALAAVVPGRLVDAETETLWATLHGLAELERSGRIRTTAREQRVALVVEQVVRPRRNGGSS